MTLQQVYQIGKQTLLRAGLESPAFDAVCLFQAVFGLDRQGLLLHGGQAAPEEKIPEFLARIEQRAARRPLQYLIGEWPFLSLSLRVGEGVLIPREDTELLVQEAARRLARKASPVALDLCAGSGAVGLGLASLAPGAQVTCVEKFDAAWEYLQQNVRRYQDCFPVYPVQADVLATETPLRFGCVDAIVSNPPYIPAGELTGLQEEVRFEPRCALDGGVDGLMFYRAFAEQWVPILKPDGFVAVEIGEGQAEAVRALFAFAGLGQAEVFRDFGGIDRVVVAYR